MQSNTIAQRHLIAAALASVIGPAWAQSSAPSTELQRVEITGTAGRGYTAGDSSTATKSPAPLLETPMAVQVVPREVIDDQKARTSLEAVQNLSGILSSTYQFYDQFLIRGFDSGYGVTFRNGLQLQGINEAVNMAFVDRIEVVKGPASMLYGRIEPGGFVNVVTKKPQAAAAYSVELEGGRWGFARATADATGPISLDRTWLYRVTADLDRSGSWVDNTHRDNKAVAATVTWRPSTTFDANLQLEHYNYSTTWLDASIPIVGDRPAALPRNFSIVFPQSWSSYPYTTKRTLVAFEWNLALSDAWRLTQRLHYVDSSENQQGVYADNFDGVDSFTGVRFTHTGPGWVRKTLSTNLDLSGEFTTGEVKHRVLVGVDWFKFTDDSPGSTGDIAGATPLNIYAPLYADYSSILQGLVASDATNIVYRDRSRDTGLYFQDQMSFGAHWELLVGGRFDRATDAYADTYGTRDSACYPNCTGYPVTAYPTDKAFSPRLGVLYKLSSTASLYASYAKSFGMSNGPDADGNPIPPQVGTQYEVGFKATLLDGRVNTSASLFDLTKTNIAEYDPITFLPRIVGEARSQGLEFDVAGQVTKHVSVIGSYTYDRAIITKDPVSGTEGRRFPGAAPQSASVWAKYDTAPGAAEGWAVGAGVYTVAQRQGDDANTWQLPGYGRIDAMLAWRARVGAQKLSAQLNVKNLLDKTYFDHGGYGAAAYGAPRSVNASLRLDF
jgi:iron complex outermembrane receptor protein